MEMKGGEEGSREPLVVSLCMSWGGGVGRSVGSFCPFVSFLSSQCFALPHMQQREVCQSGV